MSDFDDVRLAGLLAAIHTASTRAWLLVETPEGEVPGAEDDLEARASKVIAEGDNVTVYSGEESLGTWTRAEFTEALRRFERFAKGLEGEN